MRRWWCTYQNPFRGPGDLDDGGQYDSRKYGLVRLGVGTRTADGSANSVEQRVATFRQATLNRFEVSTVVLRSNVLEHSYGDNTIQLFTYLPVVLKLELHIQPSVALLSVPQFFP